MKRLAILLLLSACFLLQTVAAQTRDLTHWVDPFIGTGGHGHTFPGATMPFGMVQLSPDTRTDNWDGSSGYHYSDDIIYGFSHTHLSGTGIPDYCDILFMPTVGEPQFFAKAGDKSVNGYASKFSHANEHAEPGYYFVKLDDDGIFAEMTSTPRVGVHRYTFPSAGDGNVILDLDWRDHVLESNLSFEKRGLSSYTIEGFRRSSSWAKDQKIYFVAKFSEPFFDQKQDQSGHSITAFRFHLNKTRQILVKVALSPVSIEGARKNLAAEMPGWDFDKVRADAKAAWNKELSKIEVSGGTDAQTRTFYTALYHTMIQPNIFNDVDGSYLGHDKKIHNIKTDGVSAGRSEGGTSRAPGVSPSPRPSDQYTVFSLWDTFRAAHPLYTIIEQKRTVDFINTFIRQYEQGGRLPVWELAGNETDCMIGYHAVSVIADAMAKGIKGFDYLKAYEAAKHSAELDRDGLAAYKKRGYISMEDENESVSKTLEYAYDDWCIAQIAMDVISAKAREAKYNSNAEKWLVNNRQQISQEIAKYWRRSGNYQNLFDKQTGFMRPKKNGSFVEPFAPNEVTFNFTEANSWQYSFFVPHDIDKLILLHGGLDRFARKLDELFTTEDKLAGRDQPDITGLIGQYAHGNEPSHHIAYLYNYVRQPWKTQKYVRKIMDEFYKPTPDGLVGNEDCGQMSAWYVLSASGFYSVSPGDPIYDIGTPLFKQIKYHLENGNTFTINAPNVSDKNIYVKSVRINGKPAFGLWHGDIMNGGAMDFEMSPVPVESLLVGFSKSTTPDITAVPLIEAQEEVPTSRNTVTLERAEKVFKKQVTVFLKTITFNSRILYSLDGSEPNEKSTLYSDPITITANTTLKAIAVNTKGEKSLTAEATFIKRPNNWTVKIDSKYNRQYTGGGDEGLIDGIRGSVNFASGEWQGYQGQDFIATVDLQKETSISKVGGGFLQNAGSWIWMPTHIEFETSTDGVNFTEVADIKTDIAPTDMDSKIRDYVQTISPVAARYVRVHAYNLGKIPSWHPGAGDEAFIFVDEIIIQ